MTVKMNEIQPWMQSPAILKSEVNTTQTLEGIQIPKKVCLQLSQIESSAQKGMLIIGESGTGKEIYAQKIHQISLRKNKPFVTLNCAGMPKVLFEKELFGDETSNNIFCGKLTNANSGILFLDEISEMPIKIQEKLAKNVLESQLDGNAGSDLNVLIIAASNMSLMTLLDQKRLAIDLYLLLSQSIIELLPLRERSEDLPVLIKSLLKEVNLKIKRYTDISEEAFGVLNRYKFPGNIRELKNILYSAALFCNNGMIAGDDIRISLSQRGMRSIGRN